RRVFDDQGPTDAAERMQFDMASVPPAMTALVAKMLAPDPKDRFADGGAALKALRAVADDSQGGPKRATWRKIGVAVVVTGVALAGVAGARAWARRHAPPPAPPLRMSLVDEGTIVVGQTAETAEKQCAELGARCNPKIMHYQVPRTQTAVAAFFLDQYEV